MFFFLTRHTEYLLKIYKRRCFKVDPSMHNVQVIKHLDINRLECTQLDFLSLSIWCSLQCGVESALLSLPTQTLRDPPLPFPFCVPEACNQFCLVERDYGIVYIIYFVLFTKLMHLDGTGHWIHFVFTTQRSGSTLIRNLISLVLQSLGPEPSLV